MNESIIKNITYVDFYKFNMLKVIYKCYPNIITKWKHYTRSKGIDYEPILPELKKQIEMLEDLRLSNEEYDYLKNLKTSFDYNFYDKSFLQRISNLRFNKNNITKLDIGKDGNLELEFEGLWSDVTFLEIYLMLIVNDLYYQNKYNKDYKSAENEVIKKLKISIEKVKKYNDETFKYADFGTRRAFSPEILEETIRMQAEEVPENFVGTSNVYLAMKYDLKPIGTMAHEMFMATQGSDIAVRNVQKQVLHDWLISWEGLFGTLLTDTFGTLSFLEDSKLLYLKVADGFRHDSSDPIRWGWLMYASLLKNGIDPKTKTMVFSDSLNMDKAITLHSYFKDYLKMSFGIGTALTGDVEPINHVIKISESNGYPVAKLSDDYHKTLSNEENFLNYLKGQYKYRSFSTFSDEEFTQFLKDKYNFKLPKKLIKL
ncbi:MULTISPECIES: nicotinate phosphoribosyltransferase [Oceanotoga]|uniref:Nicotinate phosphoribosyltransferase n=1 Tax=Oceanotoga teriensis TaxID=515440 RepID=A0AA45C6U5_9BACT|nr:MULTISPECIES: nicotinate phosphoribosyltransferase [Oceanotoga]MDN5342827.1 nicotinate phosphoribosyltransferase [Oceanotoga sp.]MDO7977794.1 nicotinate phosphoribosyltransferase [Oceanotoga teriensis]PWJ93203.1 nicotinate phosphoribosyltransferase [Oceanotoga teriensis]